MSTGKASSALSQQLLLRVMQEECFGIHIGTGNVMERLVKLFRQLVRPILPQPGVAGIPHNGEEPGTAIPPMKIAKKFVGP